MKIQYIRFSCFFLTVTVHVILDPKISFWFIPNFRDANNFFGILHQQRC